jgi:hypothetical protein
MVKGDHDIIVAILLDRSAISTLAQGLGRDPSIETGLKNKGISEAMYTVFFPGPKGDSVSYQLSKPNDGRTVKVYLQE